MKRKFIPILLSGLMLLGACGGNSGTEVKTLLIENKSAIEAEWHLDEKSRLLSFTSDPVLRYDDEINNGNLTVESSNTTVASVNGKGVFALSVGEATISVKYKGKEFDTAKVTILKERTAKEKYGCEHEGTQADPLTNEDAIKVGVAVGTGTSEEYYITGTVASWYHAPGERASSDGVASFFLTPKEAGGEQFEIYKCLKADGSKFLAEDDDKNVLWKGATIVAKGAITSYNSQRETSSAVLISATGDKPADRQNLTKTFAEAKTDGLALIDGDVAYDNYVVEAYVTKKNGSNYFLTATKGESIAKDTDALEIYNYEDSELEPKLLKDAKIKLTARAKRYHEQVEFIFVKDITVLEAGTPWPEPVVEPDYLQTPVAGEYYYGLLQTTLNKVLYINGEFSGNYLKTTERTRLAVKVTLTTLDDGWSIKLGEKYLSIEEYEKSAGSWSLKIVASDTPAKFTWNDVAKTLVSQTLEHTGEPAYIGTYGNFNTLSASKLSYLISGGQIKAGQCPSHFYSTIPTEPAPTGVTLSSESAEVKVGETLQITATITGPKGYDPDLVWTSSDTDKATVANGVVTGVAEGDVTITATSAVASTVTDSITITVKPSGTFAFKLGSGKYLGWTSGNNLYEIGELNASSSWNITLASDGTFVFNSANDSSRYLVYNASSPRFCCYTGKVTLDGTTVTYTSGYSGVNLFVANV